MTKKKNNGSGSQGFVPQEGQTKKMKCILTDECKKLAFTWHTWENNSCSKNAGWRCNTCKRK